MISSRLIPIENYDLLFFSFSRPIPHKEFVENYIKAYYLPEQSIDQWIRENTVRESKTKTRKSMLFFCLDVHDKATTGISINDVSFKSTKTCATKSISRRTRSISNTCHIVLECFPIDLFVFSFVLRAIFIHSVQFVCLCKYEILFYLSMLTSHF